jgi:hypothetical protein
MLQAMRNAMKQVAVHAFLVMLALGAGLPAAQAGERIHFAHGSDNAAVHGSVTGSHHRDYVLGARAGQTMSVSLINQGSAYFNILPPGSQDVAIFIGSRDGENASVRLPSDGDYTLRVYLMGNDKDSGRMVPYTLSVTIL